MMGLLNVFLLLILAHFSFSFCPESDTNLVKWSDYKNTWDGSPPTENDNVTISKRVLLDEQPPTLWSITIESGGKLVWDPKTSVHLKIHWIRVDGELHIGSEDCPFTERTRVTFLGNVNENDLGPGGDKALFVMPGGVLEIHGKPKLSWTKLTQTADKMTTENGLHTQQKNLASGKASGKGLVVYDIDPTSGKINDEIFANLNKKPKNLPAEVLKFVTFLKNIPTGNLVGFAVKRELSRRGDIEEAFRAIEILAGQDEGTNPLRSTDGAAYVLFTKKGSPETTREMYAPWDDSEEETIASVSVVSGDMYVILRSVYRNQKPQVSYADVMVADDLVYRPILNLLDNASTWEKGDNLILASTDYRWEQAEEVKVITCDICTSDKQIRLSAPLKYMHYGEIYKNVDMRAEIGLLSRNILFDSEDAEGSDTYGGNLKVTKGFKSVHIENAEFDDLGQQEVLGRYPLHFHMCDDVDLDKDNIPWLKHNSIHHSNSRCVTVHGTHGLVVEDNVCYLTMGHGYFLEDGGEKRTVLDGNLGLGTQKGKLIKADRSPATFWITNPITFVRNNAAAGGDGKGYWYAFPELPLGPSKDKGYMELHEARHTPISEFDNNVAHSYKQTGLFFDNEFSEDTDALGYNRYRPVEDPIMHAKFHNSTDTPAIFNRFTGYKNSPRNAWLRGGMLKITRFSLSDSPQSIMILKENAALQYFEESVIIGDSPNLGEVHEINGAPVSIGRSFPVGMQDSDRYLWRTGYAFRHGPMHVKDVYFDDFVDNEYYHMGAIGFDNVFKQSIAHTVENAQFGFSDPSEGNRVQIKELDPDPTNKLFDDIRSFRDIGYSVAEINLNGDTMTAITPIPLVLTDKCTVRKNWNFAYCEHTYGVIEVGYMVDDNVLTMTRDDNYKLIHADGDSDHEARFPVIVGETEYSYSMFFENEVPETFKINAQGITNSLPVRLGICLPPNAEFELMARYPTKFMMKKWTNVSSLNDLDSPGKYFYDSETGYLAVYLQHDNDLTEDEDTACPQNSCAKVSVEITSGDRKQTDCLDAVHDKYDLTPTQSVSRRRLSQLLSLLAKQTHKYHHRSHELHVKHGRRFGRSADSVREIPATASQPPSNWGAGATR